MDGNGRWAKKRFLPRVAGHVKGVKRVKEIVAYCSELKVPYLTLFAFGRENWKRPAEEVSFLMKLLYDELSHEFEKLHKQHVRVRFIGDRTRLNDSVIQKMNDVEQLTLDNEGLNLNIALDYSGRYDILQAINNLLSSREYSQISEEIFEKFLLTYPCPAPDLLIRTSGETRISNFMLWQLAYTECYFIDKLWPDFTKYELDLAIKWYNTRERRYGMTSEQISL